MKGDKHSSECLLLKGRKKMGKINIILISLFLIGLLSLEPGIYASATQSEQASVKGRNQHYEDILQKNFGVKFINNNCAFDGKVVDQVKQQLGNPKMCLEVLKKLKVELNFDQICILALKPSVLIVCNCNPPLGLVTTLGASEVAELVSTIIQANGKTVYQYDIAILLTLP